MKKLYTYVPLDNSVETDGILSPAKSKNDLKHYQNRAGSTDKADILLWLEQTFPGRSRSVSCLTEPIKWQGNDPMLKGLVSHTVLFSYDLDQLLADGIVEAVYCKSGSDANGNGEIFCEVSADEIDYSPLPWEKCNREKGLLYAVIRHYLLVLKEGYIPPKYLVRESV